VTLTTLLLPRPAPVISSSYPHILISASCRHVVERGCWRVSTAAGMNYIRRHEKGQTTPGEKAPNQLAVSRAFGECPLPPARGPALFSPGALGRNAGGCGARCCADVAVGAPPLR
jgi:hypothetical protein